MRPLIGCSVQNGQLCNHIQANNIYVYNNNNKIKETSRREWKVLGVAGGKVGGAGGRKRKKEWCNSISIKKY